MDSVILAESSRLFFPKRRDFQLLLLPLELLEVVLSRRSSVVDISREVVGGSTEYFLLEGPLSSGTRGGDGTSGVEYFLDGGGRPSILLKV